MTDCDAHDMLVREPASQRSQVEQAGHRKYITGLIAHLYLPAGTTTHSYQDLSGRATLLANSLVTTILNMREINRTILVQQSASQCHSNYDGYERGWCHCKTEKSNSTVECNEVAEVL